MAEEAKKSIRFWMKLLAAVIAVAVIIGLILQFVPGSAARVNATSLRFVTYLKSAGPVPNWALFVLALGWLLFVAALVLIFRMRPGRPSFLDYRVDKFFDATWRWGYRWRNHRVNNIHGFCTTCDRELIGSVRRGGYAGDETVFACENCKREVWTNPGRIGDALGRVRREIEVNVRRRVWTQAPIADMTRPQ